MGNYGEFTAAGALSQPIDEHAWRAMFTDWRRETQLMSHWGCLDWLACWEYLHRGTVTLNIACCICWLTLWGRYKFAAILHTTFSIHFHESNSWFSWGLVDSIGWGITVAPNMRQGVTSNNDDPVHWRIYASLGLNESKLQSMNSIYTSYVHSFNLRPDNTHKFTHAYVIPKHPSGPFY